MDFCILTGSPRPQGNTAQLLKPFVQELVCGGARVEEIALAALDIKPCLGCYCCQDVEGAYGCVQRDDAAAVMERLVKSACIVLATPIYTWYCPAAMKALLDRTYGLNKFYGSARGSLWNGQYLAILATHGYEAAYAVSPFETGVRRLCEHARLRYAGLYSVRDEDDLASFQTEEAAAGAKAFARALLAQAW